MQVRVFEAGTGVGGTWYWNRYPGARFDSESYSYGYSFSQELLEEWNWTEHFSPQPETLRYLNYRRRQVRPAPRHPVQQPRHRRALRRGDAELGRDAGGRQPAHAARFLITAIGPLSAPTMPRIPGVESFKGQSFHTARWPHEAGELRRQARGRDRHRRHRRADHPGGRQDRRPPHRVPAHAQLVRAAAQRQDLRGGDGARSRPAIPEMFKRCQETFACFLHTPDPRGTFEVTPEEREAFFEKLYGDARLRHLAGQFPRHADRPRRPTR